MNIIGRKREEDVLNQCLRTKRPEFVAVYGRRRVGKTYLIKEFFHERFSFYATGLSDSRMKGQLRAFHDSLRFYGSGEKTAPKDWFEAFSRLRDLLSRPDVYREPTSNRLIVFMDEVPWMDTQKSDFRSALEFFWNSWGSAREDLMLIVCGSATSWIISHLLNDHGGFHNRITKRLHLQPFSLHECELFLNDRGIPLPRNQILECYMTFGGIPYYLNLLDPRLSLTQNIDELCFKPYGDLYFEYDNLFKSLYKRPEKHLLIVKTLAGKKAGMTRNELAEIKAIGGGSTLTKDLLELEECGFIRKYKNVMKSQKEEYYQLMDPFVLFAIRFLQRRELPSWNQYIHSPGYYAWRGNAFEIACLNHIPQIKAALGISGVSTSEYSWRSSSSDPGAQIDLIIDREDGLINLCEMKCTDNPYEIGKEEYEKLQNRRTAFIQEMKPKKAIHITLVCSGNVKQTAYLPVAQNILSEDDLFAV